VASATDVRLPDVAVARLGRVARLDSGLAEEAELDRVATATSGRRTIMSAASPDQPVWCDARSPAP
jgi:hypothetical protein